MIPALKALADNPPKRLTEPQTRALIQRAQLPTTKTHNRRRTTVSGLPQPPKFNDITAADELLEHNFRLVYKIACKCHRAITTNNPNSILSVDDFIQAATIGFYNAVAKFDLSRGIRFSTYVVASMRNTCLRMVENNLLTIRVAVHAQEHHYKIRKASEYYIATHHRQPTNQQLVQLTGLTASKIQIARTLPYASTSMDAEYRISPNSEKEDLYSRTIDPESDPSDQPVILADIIAIAKINLTPEDYRIISLHYGLDPNHIGGLTFKEISKIMGGTRQRIEQRHANALEILRRNSAIQREQTEQP